MTLLLLAACCLTKAQVTPSILSDRHAMVRLSNAERYVLLPVEEKAEMANIRVLNNNNTVETLNVRLAVDKVDYFVPLEINANANFNVNVNDNVNTQPSTLNTQRSTLHAPPSTLNAPPIKFFLFFFVV